MNNYFVLLSGELLRMKKYYIMYASLVAAFIWIGMMHFINLENVTEIFPLLLFLDATSMAILLVGATMFFEKQEGSIKTLLVSPITEIEYILAKITANLTFNLETLFLLYLYAYFFKIININLPGIIGAVILVAFFHSMLGFYLSYISKDFTELLVNMFKYFLLLTLPVLLVETQIITSKLINNLIYILPTRCSLTVLSAAAGNMKTGEVIFSISYLVIASIILYVIVRKKFDEYAVRESGV